MTVSETLEIKSGSGWQALGRPVITSFDTTNGHHAFMFSFVPQSAYGSVRIVIDLTVAGQTRQRATVLQVVR
jgi:hypothetical protein